jgi:hypothetical protein
VATLVAWQLSFATSDGFCRSRCRSVWGPKQSEVRIADDILHVKYGWGFRTAVPLSSIVKAEPNEDRVTSWGAHGWRGRWLVNGSSKGIVELTIDPATKAHVMGVPVTLRTLWVSVTDPEALIEACTPKA